MLSFFYCIERLKGFRVTSPQLNCFFNRRYEPLCCRRILQIVLNIIYDLFQISLKTRQITQLTKISFHGYAP